MMNFPVEPPMNTPPNAAVIAIHTVSRQQTMLAVPPANVEEIFESFVHGQPFAITSAVMSNGKFVKAMINPALVEFMRVELAAPQESGNVRSIQRVRPFDPDTGNTV